MIFSPIHGPVDYTKQINEVEPSKAKTCSKGMLLANSIELHLDWLTLACFEAPVRLINHINSALAPDNSAIAMTVFRRFQGVTNFHNHTDVGYSLSISNKAKNPPEHTDWERPCQR